MHKIKKNVEKHLLEEGKVYMVINGKPVELPIANGCVYVVVEDALKPLPKPVNGFGSTEVQYREGKFISCQLKENYKPNEL